MSEESLGVRERLSNAKQIINFIGPEGSGKTTIAKRLASESGKPMITVSDILRDFANNDKTFLGEECRAMFSQHRYMNSDILLEIYAKWFIKQDNLEDGFILDGGLRADGEVMGFQAVLDRIELSLPVTVILLRVPGWLGAQRSLQRGRDDDTIDGTLRRLSRYYDHLGQRAADIENQKGWRLIHINAAGTVDETFKQVVQAINQ